MGPAKFLYWNRTLRPCIVWKGQDITVFRGEISNIDDVKTIILENRINTIVHLVSTLIPGSSFDDYQREFTNVLYPSVRLMEFCSEQNIKFVYFSSRRYHLR